MTSIPTAEISAFLAKGNNDSDARREAATQFATAVRSHGCAAVTGHGLPEDVLKSAFVVMKKLFDLPLEQKMQAPHPDGAVPHRGYSWPLREKSGQLGALHTDDEAEKAFLLKAQDWKESYDIGHEDNEEQPNIWLADDIFSDFRSAAITLYDRLSKIAMTILQALMLGMDLDEADCETLRKLHDPQWHQMRFAHYLEMTPEKRKDPNTVRLAPHRDFACFTLLFQDSGSGLEFQNRETGEYMPAEPKAGTLYLNIGDLFHRYSNGFYPSALHRVTRPVLANGEEAIPSRYSIPYFIVTSHNAMVEPVPTRVRMDGEKKFEGGLFSKLASEMFNKTQTTK